MDQRALPSDCGTAPASEATAVKIGKKAFMGFCFRICMFSGLVKSFVVLVAMTVTEQCSKCG